MIAIFELLFYHFFTSIVDPIILLSANIKYYFKLFFYKEQISVNTKIKDKENLLIYVNFTKEINASMKNIFDKYDEINANILFISNTELSTNLDNYLKDKIKYKIIRSNIGYDFGAYKRAAQFIFEKKINFHKVIFMNDSFIVNKNFVDLINNSLTLDEKVVGLFENFFIHYHIQSFYFVLEKSIFEKTYKLFFQKYKPLSNRLHTINKGEIVLSKIIKSITDDINVMYDINSIRELIDSKFYSDNEYRKYLLNYLNILSTQALRREAVIFINKKNIRESLNNYYFRLEQMSTAHYAAVALFEECPIVKKDICFRAKMPIYFILQTYQKVFDEDLYNFFAKQIRVKGNLSSQKSSLLNSILVRYGRK